MKDNAKIVEKKLLKAENFLTFGSFPLKNQLMISTDNESILRSIKNSKL